MLKSYCVRIILIFVLGVSNLLVTSPSNTAAAQESVFDQVNEKMTGISEKEKEVVEKLFSQVQKIEEAEKRVEETAAEIKAANDRIEGLKKKIEDDEAVYEKERESLKEVLQCYQRMGPGSYLEIILKSDSLPDLLTRINTLRDLTRNTGKLLDKITQDKEKQTQEKAKLSGELALVQEKHQQQAKALAEEKKMKEDLEKFLASLSEERAHYQEYLDKIQTAWEELKLYFSNTSKELSEFLKEVELPKDAIKISISLFSARATIDDKTINDIIAGNPMLNVMKFSFRPDKVVIEISDKNLSISGEFVIVDGHSLKFTVEEGSFYGLPIDKKALEELMQDKSLELDLESQLQGLTLKSVDIVDGYVNIKL